MTLPTPGPSLLSVRPLSSSDLKTLARQHCGKVRAVIPSYTLFAPAFQGPWYWCPSKFGNGCTALHRMCFFVCVCVSVHLPVNPSPQKTKTFTAFWFKSVFNQESEFCVSESCFPCCLCPSLIQTDMFAQCAKGLVSTKGEHYYLSNLQQGYMAGIYIEVISDLHTSLLNYS